MVLAELKSGSGMLVFSVAGEAFEMVAGFEANCFVAM